MDRGPQLVLASLLLLQVVSGQVVPGFSLNGVVYPNHGLVLLSEVGEGDNALNCASDDTACCSSGFRGEFYFPNMDTVPVFDNIAMGDGAYYRNRGPGRIFLHRQPAGTTSGLFRCRIGTTANSNGEDFYIGVYDENSGSPTITSVTYDNMDTLTCTSTGGPATTVTWRKNCVVLAADNADYTQSQSVTSTGTATYSNTLTIGSGVTDRDGVYTCTVTNARGTDSSQVGVGADYSTSPLPVTVSITGGTPALGASYTLTCVHNTAAGVATSPVSFQWTGPGGTPSGTNDHMLTFNSLSESDIGEYGCQVAVGGGPGERLGCGVRTIAASLIVEVTGGTAMAGASHTLTCAATGAPQGSTPMYIWSKGSTTLSSCTTSDCLISPVQVTDAGDDYICEVTAGSATASGTGTLRVTLPSPTVRFAFSVLTIHYVGLDLDWSCEADLTTQLPGVTADIVWRRGDNEVTSSGARVTVRAVETDVAGRDWQRRIEFRPLSATDDGTYTCTATIRPTVANAFVDNGVDMGMDTMTVVIPTLTVELSDPPSRVLDVTPYNAFSLTCTATNLVSGSTSFSVTKTIQWMRAIDSSAAEGISSSNEGVTIMDSNLEQSMGTSTLSVTATTAGQHTYTCRAALVVSPATDDISGQDSASVTVQGPTPPNAPTNLANTSVSHDRATIEWTVSSIAYTPETYRVRYGTASDSLTSTSNSVPSGSGISGTNLMFSVVLTGLTLRTQYFYQVEATNTADSTTSAGPPETFTTTGLPPNSPTSLQSTRLSSTSYRLLWTLSTVTNGVLSAHVISCDPQLDGLGTVSESVGGSAESGEVSGLENGVTYSCTVRAVNDAGSSPESEPVTFTTDEAAPTASVASGSLSVRPVDGVGRNIIISWDPPSLTERNGVITSYNVTCTSNGNPSVTMTYPEAGEYTLTGFVPVTQYDCRVVATNNAGMGPEASSTVMTSVDVPSPPRNVMAVIVVGSPDTVDISWDVPSMTNGVIERYNIMCTSIDQGHTVSNTTIGSIRNVRMFGFIPATNYMCNVTAQTEVGQGLPGDDTVLTVPAQLTVTGISKSTSTTLTVRWTYDNPPSGAVIDSYTIYVDGASVGTANGGDNEFTITGLAPFTNYSIQVSAFNGNEGARSEIEQARTAEGLPEAVNCGTEWRRDGNMVTVSWTKPGRPNGVILNYIVKLLTFADGDVMSNVVVDAEERSFSFNISDLSLVAGVPYNVSIAANNSAGAGVVCVLVDFTDELEPPQNILGGFAVKRVEDNSVIEITWTVLPLNEARGFVSLTITFDSVNAGRRKRQADNVCTTSPCEGISYQEGSARITGLNPQSDYDVRVRPVNGEEEAGSVVTMTSLGVEGAAFPIAIVIAVVVVLLVLAVVAVVVIIIVVVYCKRRAQQGKFAPSYRDDEQAIPMKGMDAERSPTPIDDSGLPPNVASPEMTVADRLRPIPIMMFSEHVQAMHHDRDKGFEKEYESVDTVPNASYDVAKLNKSKNRFANIFPYDFSRVKLGEIEGVEGSEYVNASYIDGYDRANAYVAAQGPMPNTIGDFWRMVFEHRLSTVVMLTKCTEAGKRKCEQYWSDNVNEQFSPPNTTLSVTLMEQMPFADYEIKKFTVSDSSQPDAPPLIVTHYHFLGWPDHGVPKFATSLIAFIRRVRSSYNKSGPPMLVHCSAGVGRTGTFILLDSMLERMQREDSVNVYEFLRNMRAKRVFMVQTQAQYVFIHDALDELITCGETDVAAHNLRMRISGLHKVAPGSSHKKFDDQFKLLNEVSRKPNDSDCSDGLQHYNHMKNRYENKVPYNINRVRLRPTGTTGGEYINASFVDGYKHRNTYIAAQAPLENTVNDFWRMIWEFKSKAIVMLCDIKENGEECSHLYWPIEEGVAVTYGKLFVTLQSEEKDNELVVRKFEIKEDKSQSSSLGGQSKTQSFVVTQFHYTQWPEKGRPNDVSLLLQMIESLSVVQRNTGNKAITVICNDGMDRTGTFICIHAQLERIKTEGVVDFFQFIKSSRIHRPQLVSELEHYIFCHDALADYLDSFDNYANFKDLGSS